MNEQILHDALSPVLELGNLLICDLDQVIQLKGLAHELIGQSGKGKESVHIDIVGNITIPEQPANQIVACWTR